MSPSHIVDEGIDEVSLVVHVDTKGWLGLGANILVEQLKLFVDGREARKTNTTSTFADNLSLPVHRWFRYPAGFSALWAGELLETEKANGRSKALDPFAGSGTVLLEAELFGVEAIGLEAHPFVARIAEAKLYWRERPKAFREYALTILEQAKQIAGDAHGYPELIDRCFPPETLSRLDALRQAWSSGADGAPLSELSWMALASILRKCSPVGTAQWQYVLPNKSKANVVDPYVAFEEKVYLMYDDMLRRQARPCGPQALLLRGDARQHFEIPEGWADLVVTSPPYANNYDYADATRLEMSFFGDVRGWGHLQETVRQYLLRACTQHVASAGAETYRLLEHPLLASIRGELTQTCRMLELERDKRPGKKPYHTMIAAYFHDMARVWAELRRVTNTGALVCFVIGDSAPYGVYVPVATWLGELALAAGFRSYNFEKTRDRNVKWKNRKHQVPLHEGRLWIEG